MFSIKSLWYDLTDGVHPLFCEKIIWLSTMFLRNLTFFFSGNLKLDIDQTKTRPKKLDDIKYLISQKHLDSRPVWQ